MQQLLDLPAGLRAVVLVEGLSDRAALHALAERRGRDLDAEAVSVVPIGGAQALGRFLPRLGPQGMDVRLAGLCDAGEEGAYRRALERAGLGPVRTRSDLERLRAALALPGERGWTYALERVRLVELLWVFFGTTALGFVAFAAGGGRPGVALPVLLAIALVGAVTAARAWRAGLDLAVATRPTQIASAPGGAPIAPLPEGSTVRVLERDPGVWRVRPPRGPAGWVRAPDLAPVDAPARPRGAR